MKRSLGQAGKALLVGTVLAVGTWVHAATWTFPPGKDIPLDVRNVIGTVSVSEPFYIKSLTNDFPGAVLTATGIGTKVVSFTLSFNRGGNATLTAAFGSTPPSDGTTPEPPPSSDSRDCMAVEVILDCDYEDESVITVGGEFGQIYQPLPVALIKEIQDFLNTGDYLAALTLINTILSTPTHVIDLSYDNSVIQYASLAKDHQIAINSLPDGLNVPVSETTDEVTSTYSYGKEYGRLQKVSSTKTQYYQKYFINGNYGKVELEAVESVTGAYDTGNVYHSCESEESVALKAIAIYYGNDEKIKNAILGLGLEQDVLTGLSVAVVLAAAFSPPPLKLALAAAAAKLQIRARICAVEERLLKQFGPKINQSIIKDTIEKAEVLPEESPSKGKEDDRWKPLPPQWADYLS
jgi:hypothetical protein